MNMVVTQTEMTTTILTRVTLNATASAVTVIEPVKSYEDIHSHIPLEGCFSVVVTDVWVCICYAFEICP